MYRIHIARLISDLGAGEEKGSVREEVESKGRGAAHARAHTESHKREGALVLKGQGDGGEGGGKIPKWPTFDEYNRYVCVFVGEGAVRQSSSRGAPYPCRPT